MSLQWSNEKGKACGMYAKKKAYRVLVGKHGEEKPLGSPRMTGDCTVESSPICFQLCEGTECLTQTKLDPIFQNFRNFREVNGRGYTLCLTVITTNNSLSLIGKM